MFNQNYAWEEEKPWEEKTVELPEVADVTPGTLKREVSVASSTIGPVLGNFSALIDYPYGCTEQLVSQTMPSVVLAAQPELAKELNKSRAALGQAAFSPQQALQRTLTQLRARQTAEGGFAMWPGGTADDFASTYALQLLLEAKDRQLAVPPDMVSKATVYLQSRLGNGDTGSTFGWRNRAQMAYLLTRQGVLVPAALANLRQAQQTALQRDKASPLATDLGAAYLAAAFALQKQDATAQALMAPVWSDLQQRVARKQPLNRWDYYYDPLVHDSTLILLGARHFPKLLASLPVESWSRLAAMIGERLGMDEYQEVSAVCTHPDFNGRGYARQLLAMLSNDILERGRTPFLHVSLENGRAKTLYERMGYRTRVEIPFWSLRRVV